MVLNQLVWKSVLKTVLKLSISAIALYVVLQKVKLKEVLEAVRYINWIFLVLSLIFLNLSQWTSTLRLRLILRIISIDINFWQNLKLYYKGMFYNLFLPGGIGGDGIKAFALNRKYKKPLKTIIWGLILDRLTGLSGLLFLGCLTLIFCMPKLNSEWLQWVLYPALFVIYPAFYLGVSLFFKGYKKQFVKISLNGMAVNLVQSTSVIFLFLAIGINRNFLDYLTVFYFATAALVFPFTIGGVGVRELIFITAPAFLPVDAQTGITFSLLFFVLNAISSLAGVFVKTDVII